MHEEPGGQALRAGDAHELQQLQIEIEIGIGIGTGIATAAKKDVKRNVTVKRFVKGKKEEKENIVKKENVENGKYSKRRSEQM